MLLVSGLELANNANLLSLQLLVDWLTGWLGDPQDQLKVAKFSRLIIAGLIIPVVSFKFNLIRNICASFIVYSANTTSFKWKFFV